MNTEQRERALLKLVQDERDKACRRLLAEAAERAAAIKRDAYRRERGLLHQRIEAERSRAQGLLRKAGAERATAERRRGELADARLLAAVWPRLRAQLAERWASADSRVQWVSTALAQARKRLPQMGWTIRHAPGWPEAERATALAELAQHGIPTPSLRADGELSAGLLIAAGGGVLDMSLEGLLQDREQVEARLLALARRGAPDAGPIGAAEVPA
ncbi:MAG: hypothetical protein LJE69_03220 [Thiohalocapsa sp.]|jgi:hypothetical protein|uniref:hypothetical protein n=1 Tax=Thiohalocapsa sp. TaxID=2497641 RepID=UPI0025ECC6C7|nr:hypothetical protein [Thiohalocapsa sp.]MCG6940245.1 hypothetical protein [Thiohalocapsa sp.]